MQFYPYFIFRSPIGAVQQRISEPVFLEALYLSTPAFYEEHQKQLVKPATEKKEKKKLEISLYKYESRATHRCTPFGLFAGLSIGEWGDENDITFDANLNQTLCRKTRLDMNVLCALGQELAKQSFVKPYLKFVPNSSIYLIGDSYRYIEYYYQNGRRFHRINRIDFTDYLARVLDKAKAGLTHQQLILLLVGNEVSEEEAGDFIDELITSQILINQLEPTVTGSDYFDSLLRELEAILCDNENPELRSVLDLLYQINELIKISDRVIFNSIDSYRVILGQLKNILPDITETNLFQTDLYKKTKSNCLKSDIQEQLRDVIKLLNKLNPIRPNHNLQEFIKRFHERYEDYEIPLLIALDTEAGVGYPAKDTHGVNELVDDVYFSSIAGEESEIKWSNLQTRLLKLITESNKQNKRVIELQESDFGSIDFSAPDLPTSYSIMFKVLNAKSNKIEVKSIGGSSAINLLGRFAGGDTNLGQIVENIAQFEQDQLPDQILAEIVHLPESRTGNILARPAFRKYEIPYLAKASVGSEFQLRMENLTLKIRNNQIILYDKLLQKEIIPRLGNAHNYSFNSLPVYQFLCDLQTQYFSKPVLGFSLGALAGQFRFLPRVEYRNCVLCPAKWKLINTDLEPLMDKSKSDGERHDLFFDLKNRLELPDKFIVAEGDNELLIDCQITAGIDTFLDLVKNRDEMVLEEDLFEHSNALISDTNGNNYTNECIAIVLNKNNSGLAPADALRRSESVVHKTFKSQSTFSIGSEWLYLKIYCGAKTADLILAEKIKSMMEAFLVSACIDSWFFIRYADPDVHLRLRLHIIDIKRYGEIVQHINKELGPLVNEHVISKIQADTYKRELGRYGDNSIELAERLFYNDSVFVANMLSMIDAEKGGIIRWQIAIRSVDEFLNDFGLKVNEKYELIEKLSVGFFQEHGGKKELRIMLDNKFRSQRINIEEILDRVNEEEKEYYPIIEQIKIRSNANKTIAQNILQLRADLQLQVDFNELLASFLHMNLDRLFMGKNRTNEFVVYDLLFRHYKSTVARSKNLSNKISA